MSPDCRSSATWRCTSSSWKSCSDARRAVGEAARPLALAGLRVSQLAQLAPDGLGGVVHHLRIRVGILVAKVEVVQAADGHDVEVAVRDLESRQHHADPLRLETRQ